MIRLTLQEIAEATGARLVPADQGHVGIGSVTTDSRTLEPGSLFVALRGEHADGHDYGDRAAEGGASAVLVEHELDVELPQLIVDDTWRAMTDLAGAVRRRVDCVAVGITGSVGKTTVKDLTAAAVGAGLRTTAAKGSFNNELGVPLTLLQLTEDSEALVAEIGARHVGDIANLAPLVAPDVAVVTAVAGVHLEIFGTIEEIAVAKGELVDALGPDGTAVLNFTDPRVRAMAERAPNVVSVAIDDPSADVHAVDITLDRHARPSATAVTPWGRAPLRLPIAGRHNIGNALFALAVAGHLGVDLDAAAAAIAEAAVSPWRGAVTEADGVVILNDAYNANPTSVAAALETLVAVERTGRTWAVLGVMAEIGETHDVEHHAIGTRVRDLGVDELVVVGPEAAAIADGARERASRDEGASTDEHVTTVPDADAALQHLLPRVGPGDVVLVKASRVGGLEVVAEGLLAARAPADADGDHDTEVAEP
jgi:UDP-N-acetylmuramoyl-tripeptide--D-alanyl-D-alanine ligase